MKLMYKLVKAIQNTVLCATSSFVTVLLQQIHGEIRIFLLIFNKAISNLMKHTKSQGTCF